ncbi:MAG: SDR family NAD(P)-dependent oxidoreductase [Cyanobacteria bacterium P01_E01_bin.34]
MSSSFARQVLITGGNRGIGFAIAKGLLDRGHEVIVTSRSPETATLAAEKLGKRATALELDVSNEESIRQAMTTLHQTTERLDGLINNAGIYPDDGIDILTVSRQLLERTMQANTFGAVRMVQECLPLLERSTDARVVNVSSGYGSLNGLSAGVPSYCLSKLALNGATIMLAQALKSEGIAVNAIDPGWVRTDMGGTSAPRSPEQGADTAIWLTTEASNQQTGKVWRDRQAVAF